MHPGGATILTGAERAVGISPEHMRASYDTYMNHGNSSSATIFSVLDRLRHKDMDALAPGGRPPRDYVVGCAFGPGIAVETCMLKRNMGASGLQTPPETEAESDASSRSGDAADEEEGDGGGDGHAPGVRHREQGLRGSGAEERRRGAAARGRGAGADESFISEALQGVELD